MANRNTKPTLNDQVGHVDESTTVGPSESTVKTHHHSQKRLSPRRNNHFRSKKPRDETYEKSSLPPSLSMVQRKQFYVIYTGSVYLMQIADIVYQAMSARVKTLRDVVSLEHFQYVVSIAWYARLVAVSIATGTSLPQGASLLKQVSAGLKLPVTICRYIETLGVVRMSNGISIVPYCSNYRDLIPLGSEFYCDPLEILQEARRPDPLNEWSIDIEWITQYNQVAYPKLMRSGVELRSIIDGPEGRPELLIGFVDSTQVNLITPISPENQTLAVARNGASYRWRDYALRDEWPFGDNDFIPPAFQCEDISPDLVLANNVSDSLQAITN